MARRIQPDALVEQLHEAAYGTLTEQEKESQAKQKMRNWQDQPRGLRVFLLVLFLIYTIVLFRNLYTLYPAERVDKQETQTELSD